MHGWMLGTVATDAVVLKHQVISINSIGWVLYLYINYKEQYHKINSQL